VQRQCRAALQPEVEPVYFLRAMCALPEPLSRDSWYRGGVRYPVSAHAQFCTHVDTAIAG